MYEELINRLKSVCYECKLWDGEKCCLKGDCLDQTRLEAADAIEELQDTVQAQDKALKLCADQLARRWTPVTEKLPEKEDEAVIVWEKQGFALIDWRHDNKWAILDNNYGIATHWMPLPEPPKDGEA